MTLKRSISVFTHHFKVVLDSYINDRTSDSSRAYVRSVMFMEGVTRIPTSGQRTTIGIIGFSRQNLECWRSWYDHYKDDLIWDNKRRMIWVKQKKD